MAEVDHNSSRPNIRIEIQNTMELMDVGGQGKFSDGEEGEIVEESVDFDDIIDNNIKYPSRPGDEPCKKTTIQFNTETEEKCFERGQRSQQVQISNFTTENLETLHESLGITAKNEKEVCFDILHLHGVEGMSEYDIDEYFDNFPPIDIEWVDQNSCNVLWSDDVSSARALYYMSRRVHGMPADGIHGKSILLKNNNREVEDDSYSEHDATFSDISIPIPAGYWRLGVPHDKTECILIRFAFISDRSFADGNKHGAGLISESKKAQFRGIFDRNRDIIAKNPWGDLAKSWNRDRKTEEVVDTPQPAPQLKHRLGFKRTQEEAFKEDEQEKKVMEKPKIPRMRMYADEEEAKIKRKKALDVLKRVGKPVKTEHKTGDLRKLIGKKVVEHVNRTVQPNEESEEGEIIDDFTDHKATIIEEPIRIDVDLGSKLMNRRLKFTNPVPISFHKRSESTDVRQRLDNKTKQNRFRDEILKNKRLKSPPPPPRPSNKHYSKYSQRDEYSDELSDEEEVYSDGDMDMKTGSKVTVVIKKPKQPTVASTVWSRVNVAGRSEKSNPPVKSRLHLPADSSRNRRRNDSSASSDDGSASSDNSSSNNYRMEGGSEDRIRPSLKARPGFRGGLISDKIDEHKSPLRIEINNDRYKK